MYVYQYYVTITIKGGHIQRFAYARTVLGRLRPVGDQLCKFGWFGIVPRAVGRLGKQYHYALPSSAPRVRLSAYAHLPRESHRYVVAK